jgi:hypothetical protein
VNTFRFESKAPPGGGLPVFAFRLTEVCQGAYYPRFLARGLEVKIK